MKVIAKVGKCQDMCPKSEFKIHEMNPNAFECDLNGKFNPKLAIKQFHRSDAGKSIEERDLRPLPVLTKTLDHILNYVIGQKTNTSPDTSELQMYYYVRDRFRSIRSDITVQNLDDPEVIRILETSCLFFIWAGSRFNMEDREAFDHKQNLEQITQSLLSLSELYDKYLLKFHQHYPSEPFFRSIDLISYLNYPGFMAKLLSFSDVILNSNYIQAAKEIRKAILTRNISLFLSILDHVPIQMASYILQNSRIIWENIGYALRSSFAKRSFPITFLTDFMKIPNEIVNTWSKSFALSKLPDQDYFAYDTKASLKTSLLPNVIVPDSFRLIQEFNNPIEFLSMNEDASSFDINAFITPKTDFSITNDQNIPSSQNIEDNSNNETKKEIAQPAALSTQIEEAENKNSEQESFQQLAVHQNEDIFQEEPINQENTPMSPPEPDAPIENVKVSMYLNDKNPDSHISMLIPNRPNSTNPMLLKKKDSRVSATNRAISKRDLIIDNPELFEAKISIKNIMAMIPYKVPRMSYACILLVADDDSYNSSFASDRFFTKNGDDSDTKDIVLCEKFTSSSETCYILITKKLDHIGVTSILYCDESEKEEIEPYFNDNIPIIKFNAGLGFSPVLTFNSCLRKAIEKGITEIKPFNLSDLIQSIFSMFLRSISYTSWQFASANAVFSILNMGLICISDHIIDASFTKFILPFEHHEFDFDELQQYSDKIKSMQFDLIDNSLSRRSISGSSWPTYIKGRIDIVFPPFIIPLSGNFDQKSFISNIMSELPFHEPSETIYD